MIKMPGQEGRRRFAERTENNQSEISEEDGQAEGDDDGVFVLALDFVCIHRMDDQPFEAAPKRKSAAMAVDDASDWRQAKPR